MANTTGASKLRPLFTTTERESASLLEDECSQDSLIREQPSLSLEIGYHDSKQQPRLSMGTGDEEQTMRSIEIARREVRRGRLSRESDVDKRLSDRVHTANMADASKLSVDDNSIPPSTNREVDENSDPDDRLLLELVETSQK